MSENKCGNQTIGCRVTSCRHNYNDSLCELARIEVAPRAGCDSCGCEESLCASYDAK